MKLRHAIEPRHESFQCPEFVAMARAANVAIVIAEHETYPQIADPTADFVYARLQCAREEEPAGYSPAAARPLGRSGSRLGGRGESGRTRPMSSDAPADARPRDVFAFFISGFKERNPLAALALSERLK